MRYGRERKKARTIESGHTPPHPIRYHTSLVKPLLPSKYNRFLGTISLRTVRRSGTPQKQDKSDSYSELRLLIEQMEQRARVYNG